MSAVLATLLFQFHKGTIKTQVVIIRRVFLLKFQFHKGTIKTDLCFRLNRCLSISIP